MPKKVKAGGSHHGDGARPGSEIMKPKVEGTPEVAATVKKAHVWGPDVAAGGIFNLLPPGGVSLDRICRLCDSVTFS